MAVDNVQTKSAVGIDGNSYTTAVSNDALTNDDFLKLMLEEMKMQDPTKPMDSKELLDSNLKMSTIKANQDMAEAMKTIQTAYANSALSTAANMIGHVVEDGSIGKDGLVKSFKVVKVENRDGELHLQTKQLVGVEDGLKLTADDSIVKYDENGVLYNKDNTPTDYRISLSNDGRFNYNDDGSLMILDADGKVVTNSDITDKYKYAGSKIVYADESTDISLSSVQKVE